MAKGNLLFPFLLISGFALLMVLNQQTTALKSPEKGLVKELRDSLNKHTSSALPDTLMLNFWASWCKPCKKEMPDLAGFVKNAKEKGYNHIGYYAITDEAKAESKAIRREHSAFFKAYQTIYNVSSTEQIMYALKGKQSIPANFIIAGDSCLYKGGYASKEERQRMKEVMFEKL
jgi:thiol-disulfide isomerase/thioredoxin